MALDVWIGRPSESGSERITSFEPEIYYCVMHPLFESLARSHGKYIDLYATVEFRPGQLSLIYRLLDDAEAQARSKPKVWKEHIGTQTWPVRKELYGSVEREKYLSFLGKLRRAADECASKQLSLMFVGD